MKVAAVILAAGYGTRMKKYTKQTPKPMLLLDGKPIIEYTIHQLTKSGVNQIGMNLHYFPDQIKNYFEQGQKLQSHIEYVYEDRPTGTAGGVKSLEFFLKRFDSFIVIYGDVLTDLDYGKLIQAHDGHGRLATVCLHLRKKSNSIVDLDKDNVVVDFKERPDEAELLQRKSEFWVNSGIYCFKKSILDLIPRDPGIVDFPKHIFPQLVARQQLVGYPIIDWNRIAIDDEERYLQAQQNIKHFKFSE